MAVNKRKNINKKDISFHISKKVGLPISYAEKILDDTISIFSDILRNNHKLKITNFGTFIKLAKNQRLGRNPKNKKEYLIKPRNVVSFKPSKNLKEKINK